MAGNFKKQKQIFCFLNLRFETDQILHIKSINVMKMLGAQSEHFKTNWLKRLLNVLVNEVPNCENL